MVKQTQKRPASAGPRPGVKYLFTDSVAILPLAVGFKPAAGSLFPLLEPFTEYKSPRASILTQTWRPYNHDVYSELDAAIKFCKLTMRKAVESKPFSVGKIDSYDTSNAYVMVLDAIQGVETQIFESIKKLGLAPTAGGVPDNDSELLVKNATTHRMNVIDFFSGTYQARTEIMRKALLGNYNKTYKVMEKVFPTHSWKIGNWDGIEQFNDFWAKFGASRSDPNGVILEGQLKAQELRQVHMILHIMNLNKELYAAVKTELIKATFVTDIETEISIHAYATAEQKKFDMNKELNEFLWNLLIERFEMLNSFVNSYFALVCNTRQCHFKMVEKFMKFAIHSCMEPIFRVNLATIAQDGKLTEYENEMNRCRETMGSMSTAFKTCSAAFIDTKVKAKLGPLSPAEETVNRNNVLNSLAADLDRWDGRLMEEKVDSEDLLCVSIANAFKDSFSSCETITLSAKVKQNGRNFKVLNVIRTKDSEQQFKLTRLARVALKVTDQAAVFAETVAYYQIFCNTTAFGFFHFKEFNLTYLFKYFSEASHPLFLNKPIGLDVKTAALANQSKLMSISPAKTGWNNYGKQRKFGTNAAGTAVSGGYYTSLEQLKTGTYLTHIFEKMVPIPSFKPETPPRPQSARPRTAPKTHPGVKVGGIKKDSKPAIPKGKKKKQQDKNKGKK